MPGPSHFISVEHRLWSASQMASASSVAVPWDWLSDAYATFEQRLLHSNPEYPCYFGVRGQKDGHNSFTALDRRDEAYGVAALAQTVRVYRQRAWQGPKKQSLVVFVGPPDPEPRLDEHRAAFWSLLQELGDHDVMPWPGDVPRAPTDPRWQWCFDGEPWFVFATSPAYARRHSRNLGPCLTLVLQVRRVFEGLGGTTAAGKAAKAQVRARLRRYDPLPEHPHLGEPDRSSTHKWRQYFLPDDQTEYPPSACPFEHGKVASEHGKAAVQPANATLAHGKAAVQPANAAHGKATSRPGPGGLLLEVVDSIAAVGRDHWDRLHAAAGGSVFYSYEFLSSLEHKPLWNDTVGHYLLFRDPRDIGGAPVAALPLYWQEDASPFDTGEEGPRPRVLLGHDWHCYDTVLLSSVPVDEGMAGDTWTALRALAGELGAARWGLVNTPRDGALATALAAIGLDVEDAPARYQLRVDGRRLTLDEHLAGVGRSSRRTLRQYWRRAERAGTTITFEEGAAVIAQDDEVLRLVDETAAKYTPGYYDLDALAGLIRALGPRCRIMRLDLEGQLLATSICLFDAARMHTWAGGCRYPDELNWSPQYVLFAGELREGLAARKRVLECGRRNDEFKQRYGLTPYPLAQVVEHS